MRTLPSTALFFRGITLVLAMAACATPGPADSGQIPPSGRFITAEMIARYDVPSAWDVLRRTGAFIMSRDAGPGRPVDIRTRRGRSSIILRGADIPQVMVDGAQMSDLRGLRDIPASSIEFIQLLNGIDATVLFGTNAGAGAIIIVSKAG